MACTLRRGEQRQMVPAGHNGRQEEFDAKLARIRAYLRDHALGGVALSSQALFAWATAGGDNHVVLASEYGVAHLLVTADKVAVLSSNIEAGRASAEEFDGLDTSKIEFWSCPWHADGGVEAEIQRRMGGQRWASDLGIGPARLAEDFRKLTYSLAETEIVRYRKLGRDCSLAMEEALGAVRPGYTEHRVAGLICQRLQDHGVRPHVVLVAADERARRFRHPIPTGKRLRQHLMAVLCGKRGGLIVALTRLLHFSRTLAAELRRKHDAVCAVDVALNAATRRGVPIGNVFAAGVAEYERQGFGEEWKLHHQGGPTGYQGRSFLGRPAEERLVMDNQAFAWNPSISGTKSEDTIVVRSGGIEFLSAPTRAWPAVSVKTGAGTFRRADIRLG
ncbi:MAG: M24 family metallopeptidase [Planctomycetota bacterium]|nr:M24 family metallopeptidase [Planctomycetota bacterium]